MLGGTKLGGRREFPEGRSLRVRLEGLRLTGSEARDGRECREWVVCDSISGIGGGPGKPGGMLGLDCD